MITIQEIADIAGVSRRTVDRVLKGRGIVKEETRKKIEQIIKETDYRPNIAAKGLAAKKKNYKIIFCSVENKNSPIQEEFRKGAVKKAKEIQDYGITVEFLTFKRDTSMSEEEIHKIIDNLTFDALVTIPLSLPGVKDLIKCAQTRGLPIVFVNLDSEQFQCMNYVGCDYPQAGRLAAGLTALCIGSKGKVSVYTSKVINDYSYRGRIAGFEEELSQRYPELKIAEKVYLDESEESYFKAVKNTRDNHPDVRAIYLVNPGNYGVCRTVHELYGSNKIHIVTNDYLEGQMEYLKDGVISATISQDAQWQAAHAVELLFNYLVYGMKNPEKRIYSRLQIYIPQSTYTNM